LHGSYFSALNEDCFKREKEILEGSIGRGVLKIRQHWLRYCERVTPYIHENCGIKEDSTIGFNDISAFRAGVASEYNPYDHIHKRPFPFKVIPLVLMDSHLYDYSSEEMKNGPLWLCECAKKIKYFAISIDWHQRVISDDYGWEGPYRRLAQRVNNTD
jgi:hypothetical protein